MEKDQSLHEQVYSLIKQAIITGELLPNEHLREMKLAERFHTSRTPVREALRKLENEGFVTYQSSIGTKVIDLNQAKIVELYECRAVLEGLAAGKAALNMETNDRIMLEESLILAKQYFQKGDIKQMIKKNTIFHETIVHSSRNASLIHLMNQIKDQSIWSRSILNSYGVKPNWLEEHEAIFEAISNKDAEKSDQLMKAHLLSDLQYIMKKFEEEYCAE
ncbi:GntR family transcriptional regulator [Halalkalibacter oceani]|uniref:GntR family transcriptional regulator n=1 Tax=Halalkalibacter oceani TaxID=1653776 RepID=UPI003398F96F